MKYLWLLILTTTLQAHSLLDSVSQGKPGSYTVYAQGDLCTVLIRKEKTGNILQLEEIQIEPKNAPKAGSFAKWISQGAPQAVEHLQYKIDLSKRKITSVYSLRRNAPLNPEHFQSTFGTLLTLSLSTLPENAKRKVGPKPKDGEIDRRKTWIPPVITAGKKIRPKKANAYETTWPKDATDLSQRKLQAYFIDSSPFPIWIQVIDPAITYRLAVKDSGILQ